MSKQHITAQHMPTIHKQQRCLHRCQLTVGLSVRFHTVIL